MRKKIDARVRTLIENCVKSRERSFFVIVGDKGRDQVVNLHYILTKAQVKSRPSVLWCYKKDLYLSRYVFLHGSPRGGRGGVIPEWAPGGVHFCSLKGPCMRSGATPKRDLDEFIKLSGYLSHVLFANISHPHHPPPHPPTR